MGWCLRLVSRDTFMLVIYCPATQALLWELPGGPAHSMAPHGNSFLIWLDGRERGVACSNQLLDLQFVTERRWGIVVSVSEKKHVMDI